MSKNIASKELVSPNHSLFVYFILFLCGSLCYIPASILFRLLPFLHKPRTRAVVIYKDHVLLVRNSIGFQRQTLPGGGLHKDELEIDGLLRELKEELNVDAKKSQCRFLGIFTAIDIKERSDKITYAVNLTQVQYESLSLSFELLSTKWVPVDQLSNCNDLLVTKALSIFNTQS